MFVSLLLLNGSVVAAAQAKAGREVFRGTGSRVGPSRASAVPRPGSVRQDAGVKIGPGGLAGHHQVRAVVEALTGGGRRPAVLAGLAKGASCAVRPPGLALARAGRCGGHHAPMCPLHLGHIDHLDQMTTTPPPSQPPDNHAPQRTPLRSAPPAAAARPAGDHSRIRT